MKFLRKCKVRLWKLLFRVWSVFPYLFPALSPGNGSKLYIIVEDDPR